MFARKLIPHYIHIEENRSIGICLRYAATVIMSLTYSKNEKSTYQDNEISRVVKCLNRFHAAAQPGKYLLDYIPWLRYCPTYLNEAKGWHVEELSLFKEQLERVRSKMVRFINT